MLRQKLCGSVRIISIDRAEALAALRRSAERLCADHPEVESVHLIGSLARGDQVGASDADVLIVMRQNEPAEPLTQVPAFYSYFDLPIGVDILVCTQDRLARRLQAGDAFMERIWTESQLLARPAA